MPDISDWSLITGKGGGYKMGGGHVKLPYKKKGGGGDSFSHAEGGWGAQTFLG